jgi:hypothetical protein
MRTAVLLLAIAGFAAVLFRAAGALVSALSGSVEGFLARDIADVRARRGDLSGLADADELAAAARRRRLVSLGVFSMWAGLLIVPALTPWPSFLYAAYSLLWLVPRRARTTLRPS